MTAPHTLVSPRALRCSARAFTSSPHSTFESDKYHQCGRAEGEPVHVEIPVYEVVVSGGDVNELVVRDALALGGGEKVGAHQEQGTRARACGPARGGQTPHGAGVTSEVATRARARTRS